MISVTLDWDERIYGVLRRGFSLGGRFALAASGDAWTEEAVREIERWLELPDSWLAGEAESSRGG